MKILDRVLRQQIRIIHLEDFADETQVVENLVSKGGFAYQWNWIATKEEYIRALKEDSPDVILCDHSMPGFSSVEAFHILREIGPDIPFILVTATVSEEFAVMMMKEGVADYVLKDRPQRLPVAIQNALAKWDAERRNKNYINQIIRSEANLSALMENSDMNIYSLDRSFRYVAFNTRLREEVERFWGLKIRIGDSRLDIYPDREKDEWLGIYREALMGKPMRLVKELKLGDRSYYYHYIISPITEADIVTGLACFSRDITKEKRAEEYIAKNEARFRALIENNFDSIAVSDENFKVMYASPSLSRTLGYLPEELVGTTNLIRFHPDDWPQVRELFGIALANPGVPMSITARVQHQRGHYIWAEGIITNMLRNESVRGIVANYRDVTERKEAEIRQAQMTRDLVQRNKDLEQFAYIVSHNLRGPVANILGISNILKHPGTSDQDRALAMKGMFAATSNLDEVIIDLNLILDTKQEVNNKKEKVVFQDIVEKIKLSIQGIIEKNNCTIITDFSECTSILSIRSFLQSIFYNLISNSIKYKQQNVDLEIRITSYRVEGSGVKLVFSDNGMGIDLTTQGSKVFGLYRRFHPKQAEGKGMGLFMVRTQVESLGGEINIKSEVNRGTEFTIDL